MIVIERLSSAHALHDAAAKRIVSLVNDAIIAGKTASIALSGGSTPQAVYRTLAEEPLRSAVDWNRVHFFWGDERCVAPTHAESNFRMTNDALLAKISIPGTNLHRMRTEHGPGGAAKLYEEELRTFFRLGQHELPRFDVTLLGIGEDGHTASLFPGTSILNEERRLVAEVFVPKLNAHRVSMTFPTINNSRVILVLVEGERKKQILHDVLEGDPGRYPAQNIQPVNGRLIWFVDDAAAEKLSALN